MKIATIDIGSNSILLLIADVYNDKLEIVTREQSVTALGKDLDKNKIFCEESMSDSIDTLKKYSNIINENGLDVSKTIVTATEASRVARNAPDFFKKIKDIIGFDITIITGAGEAYYSAKGACLDVKDLDEITLMDIGGASTELVNVKLNPFKIVKYVSLPIGSVRVTNWNEEKILNQKLEELSGKYLEQIKSYKCERLLCVAGTMTSIANMYQELKSFDEEKVHNFHIKKDELDSLKLELVNYNSEMLQERYPFLGKRSKAIGGGLIVASHLTSLLEVKYMTVSTYGLMFGTAIDQGVKDEFIFRG